MLGTRMRDAGKAFAATAVDSIIQPHPCCSMPDCHPGILHPPQSACAIQKGLMGDSMTWALHQVVWFCVRGPAANLEWKPCFFGHFKGKQSKPGWPAHLRVLYASTASSLATAAAAPVTFLKIASPTSLASHSTPPTPVIDVLASDMAARGQRVDGGRWVSGGVSG